MGYKKKIIAALLCCCFFATLLFSAFFLIIHSDHACTGEACPVCAHLKECADTVKKLGSGLWNFNSAFFFFLVVQGIFCTFYKSADDKRYTLIELKVRLND